MRHILAFIASFLIFSGHCFGQKFDRTFNDISEMSASNPNVIHTNVTVASEALFGDGKFYYDKSETNSVDGGIYFDAIGNPGRWVRIVKGGIYYPEWWGAKGDGVTDDTTPIDKAIVEAVKRKGRVQLLPGKVYVTSGTTIPQWGWVSGYSQQGEKNAGEGGTVLKLKPGTVGGYVIRATGEFQLDNVQIDGNKDNVFGSPIGIWVDKSGLFAESMISGVSVVNSQGDSAYIDAHEIKIRDCTFTKGDARGLVLDDVYDVMVDHALTGWNAGNGFEAKANGATLRIQQLDSYYNRGNGVVIRSPLWVYIDRLQCDFNFQNGTEIEVGSTASNIQINYPLIYGSNVDQDNFGVLNPAASGTYSDFVISGTQYPKSIRIDGGKIGNSTASTKKPEYHIKWSNSQPGIGFGVRLQDVDLDTNSGANTSTGKSTQDTWLNGSWTGRIMNHRDGTNVRTVTKESYVYATTDFTTSPVLNILNNYDLVVRSNIFAQGYVTANSAVYSGRGITSDKSGVQIKADTGSTIGLANSGDQFLIQNDVNSNPQLSLNTRSGEGYLSGTSTNASGDWKAFSLKMTLNQSGTAGSRGFRAELTPTALGSGSHRPFEYTYSGGTRWLVDHNGRMVSTSPSGIGPLTLQSESGTDSRIRLYYSEVLDRGMDVHANSVDVTTISGGTGATLSLNPSGGNVQIGGGLVFGSSGPQELKGAGSPEGVVTAPVSSTYRRTDGASSTAFYVKESGSGNTGWVAYGAAGAGGVASSRQILTSNSLAGGGDLTADRTLQLVNDTASPGANKVYGTDGSGVRGWKNDPAGGSGAPTTVDYLVKTADAGLSAERVVGDSTSITANWGTAGAVSFERAAITGDVAIPANGNSSTIQPASVSYSKIQNVSAASRLLGRGSAAGAGSAQEITLGAGLTMSGTTLTASGATVADSDYGDITVSSSGLNWFLDNSVVTYAKIQDMSVTRLLGRKTASGVGPPEELTTSDILDWTSGAAPAMGDILYRGASSWARLSAGTSGLFLQTQGTGSSPQWAAPTVAGSALTGSTLASGITASSLTSFGNSPTLVTPNIGVATATSVNKLSITAPTTSATLTVADGKTFTANNSLTLSGADGSTLNVGAGGTLGSAAFSATSAFQASDSELTAIAGLTSASDTLPYFTGSGTAGTTALTSAGRSLIGGVNAAAQRTTLGLAIGTDVQAFDSELSALAGLTSAADKLPYFTGAGTAATADFTSAARSLISLSTAKAILDALNGGEATVASSATTDLGAASSDKVSITGTTTITSFGTATAGIRREGRFTASLLLTHNATSLILPGGSSITTAAGDRFTAYSLGAGNWVVTAYNTAGWTGTGSEVHQVSPSLTTPNLNVATATSINKVAITAPATSATLTISDGKTLGVQNTVTFAGTDGNTYTLPDVSSDIGFRNIPQNSQSAAYTLVLSDAGKHIFHPSGDANSRTYTIPANASVAFAIGTTVTFYNASASSCTIAITTDTLRKAGTGTTGSVSLPQYAIATIMKITSTEWVISGNGI